MTNKYDMNVLSILTNLNQKYQEEYLGLEVELP